MHFIHQPTNTKAYRPTQFPILLRPLTDQFELDVGPPAEGIKTLGVPLGPALFVREFKLAKFGSNDDSFRLPVTRKDG